jgi:octaprenyl-diphosphate synthase
VIAEGEVLQLSASHNTATTEEIYLRVVRAKTAELFCAACAVGGLVAERTPDEVAALADFGANLGMAFQLVDDVLDYSALQARLGKTVGDDFKEGKITLPVVLAIARGDGSERSFWRRTLEDQGPEDGDLDRAIAILEKHDCLTDSIARARTYGDAARQALARFPENLLKACLLDVVSFCIERDY